MARGNASGASRASFLCALDTVTASNNLCRIRLQPSILPVHASCMTQESAPVSSRPLLPATYPAQPMYPRRSCHDRITGQVSQESHKSAGSSSAPSHVLLLFSTLGTCRLHTSSGAVPAAKPGPGDSYGMSIRTCPDNLDLSGPACPCSPSSALHSPLTSAGLGQ